MKGKGKHGIIRSLSAELSLEKRLSLDRILARPVSRLLCYPLRALVGAYKSLLNAMIRLWQLT